MVKADWDTLSTKIKREEHSTRIVLPSGSYAILRLDGRHFHTYTKHLKRPYDTQFMADMNTVAETICQEISGTIIGYVQSDEITVVFSDLAKPETQMWFGGVVQKIVSVTAGLASATLARLRPDQQIPMFDARVYAVEDFQQVVEALAWRQEDATRNSILMCAQAVLPQKQLDGKSVRECLTAASTAGMQWSSMPEGFKHGRIVIPATAPKTVTYKHKKTGEENTVVVERKVWKTIPAFRFADPAGDGNIVASEDFNRYKIVPAVEPF